MELFPVYSLAKSFSAAAVVALGIPLDAPLAELVDVPEPFRRLTLRSVLRHRSGMPDYYQWTDYQTAIRVDEPWSLTELLDRAQRVPFGTPGEFQYSNVGYAIVRGALEYATGLSFFSALSTSVFPALRIRDAQPFATPVDWDACVESKVDVSYYDPGWVLTGTFVSTTETLATAYSRLLGGDLVDPALLLETFPVDAPNDPFAEPGYGLGLMTDGFPPRYAGHGGGGPGFSIFALATADGSFSHVEFEPDEIDGAILTRRCQAALA